MKIANRVTSIIEGYEHTQQIMKTVEKDAYLTCVLVDITVLKGKPEIEKSHYSFISIKKEGLSFWVKIDNSNLLLSVNYCDGLNMDEIRKFDKYLYSPLDISNVTIDITEVLRIAKCNSGDDFLKTTDPKDTQVDMRLAPAKEGSVWYVTYDAWGDKGPKGYLRVMIDARTGKIISSQWDKPVNDT